jgi:glycosyltransferase involved in cell wall biosynthesis
VLLEALSGCPPEWRVSLAGDGPLRDRLEAEVARRELTDQVQFLGFLPHQQLLHRLEAGEWDLVVLPSIERGAEHEGIPAVLLEALARGVPVVATTSGSITELLGEIPGSLVPHGNSAALRRALNALASDPNQRASVGQVGRAVIEESFDAKRTTELLLANMRWGGLP